MTPRHLERFYASIERKIEHTDVRPAQPWEAALSRSRPAESAAGPRGLASLANTPMEPTPRPSVSAPFTQANKAVALPVAEMGLVYTDVCTTPRGIANFIEEYKRQQFALPALVRIQSWWRGIRQRHKFLRFRRSTRHFRAKLCEPALGAWKRVVRALRYRKQTILRHALKALEMNAVYARLRYKSAAVFLQTQGQTPVFVMKGESITTGARAHRIVVAFRAKMMISTLRGVVQQWYQWCQHRKKRRAFLVALMEETNKKQARNVSRLCLQMWHRYSVFISRLRQNKTAPRFHEQIPAWERFLNDYERLKRLWKDAQYLNVRFIYKVTMDRWKAYVADERVEKAKMAKAVAKHRKHLFGLVWGSWRHHTVERRAWKFYMGKWFGTMFQQLRRQHVGYVIAERNRLERMRFIFRRWRALHQHSTMLTLAARHSILEAPLFARVAMHVLRQDVTRYTFLKCWIKWTRLARRRVAWVKLAVLHRQQRELRRLNAAFCALRGEAENAGLLMRFTINERTVIENAGEILNGAPPETEQEQAQIARLPLGLPSRFGVVDTPMTRDELAQATVRRVLVYRRRRTADNDHLDVYLWRKVAVLMRAMGRQRSAVRKARGMRALAQQDEIVTRDRAYKFCEMILGVENHPSFRAVVEQTDEMMRGARDREDKRAARDRVLLTNHAVRTESSQLEMLSDTHAFSQTHDAIRVSRRFTFAPPPPPDEIVCDDDSSVSSEGHKMTVDEWIANREVQLAAEAQTHFQMLETEDYISMCFTDASVGSRSRLVFPVPDARDKFRATAKELLSIGHAIGYERHYRAAKPLSLRSQAERMSLEQQRARRQETSIIHRGPSDLSAVGVQGLVSRLRKTAFTHQTVKPRARRSESSAQLVLGVVIPKTVDLATRLKEREAFSFRASDPPRGLVEQNALLAKQQAALTALDAAPPPEAAPEEEVRLDFYPGIRPRNRRTSLSRPDDPGFHGPVPSRPPSSAERSPPRQAPLLGPDGSVPADTAALRTALAPIAEDGGASDAVSDAPSSTSAPTVPPGPAAAAATPAPTGARPHSAAPGRPPRSPIPKRYGSARHRPATAGAEGEPAGEDTPPPRQPGAPAIPVKMQPINFPSKVLAWGDVHVLPHSLRTPSKKPARNRSFQLPGDGPRPPVPPEHVDHEQQEHV